MIQRINQGAIDPYRKKKKKGKSKRRKIKEAMSEEGKGQLSRNNKFRAKNNNRGPDDGKTWSSRALPIT